MRLEPREVPALPLVAALVDRAGTLVAATPEWDGPGPGTLTYHAGQGSLLVGPDSPVPQLDFLMTNLLDEIEITAGRLVGEPAHCTRVLAAGLALVAGRVAAGDRHPIGSAAEVVTLTRAAIGARTQGMAVEERGSPPPGPVPAPAAIALALGQIAVNAQQHGAADRVFIHLGLGPTFSIEWPSSEAGFSPVSSHRHPRRRGRWGWGYVQMVADALGAVALPPGAAGPGLMAAGLALGAPRLTLPVACLRAGVVERCTPAWEDDPALPRLAQPVSDSLSALIADSSAHPGSIAYRDLLRARRVGDRTWVTQGPAIGSSRALDLLRGLDHERALWNAPEPHATRVAALATLLRVAMGEPWPSVPPAAFEEGLAAACMSLGVHKVEPVDAVCAPDPRVTAYLLAELGGRLVHSRDGVFLAAPNAARHPLLRALGGRPDGWLRLTP
jgi:hypothetical protein